MFNDRTAQCVVYFDLVYNCEQRKCITLWLFLYTISNENLKFCTKMYMRYTGQVYESITTINKTFVYLTKLFFAKWNIIVIFNKYKAAKKFE